MLFSELPGCLVTLRRDGCSKPIGFSTRKLIRVKVGMRIEISFYGLHMNTLLQHIILHLQSVMQHESVVTDNIVLGLHFPQSLNIFGLEDNLNNWFSNLEIRPEKEVWLLEKLKW